MKILIWLKENVGSVIVAFIAALGAGIFWSYHKGRIRSFESQKAIERAHKEVAHIDGQIAELETRKEENRSQINRLQESRHLLQRQTLKIEQDVRKMTDEQIEQAFKDLY